MDETTKLKQSIATKILDAIHNIPNHTQFTLKRIDMDKFIYQNASENALAEIKNIVSSIHQFKYIGKNPHYKGENDCYKEENEYYKEEMERLKNALLQVSIDSLNQLLGLLNTVN